MNFQIIKFQRNDWETESLYNHSWKKIPESKQFTSLEHGVQKVQKGYYAYHADPDNIYPIIEKTFSNKEICELAEVHLLNSAAYLAVRKYSPYFEMQKIGYNVGHGIKKPKLAKLYRFRITKLSEVGIGRHISGRYSSRKPHCRSDILSINSVRFFETAYLLVVWIAGVVLSILIWLIENIFYHFFQKESEVPIEQRRLKFWKIAPRKI